MNVESCEQNGKDILVGMVKASPFYDGQSFGSAKYPQKFSLGTKFNDSLAKTPVSIVFPVNKRTYNSQGLINIWNGKDKLDSPYLDIRAVCTKKGDIILYKVEGSNIYAPLSFIFPKYWTKNCGWDYFIDKNFDVAISIPKTKEGWTSLLKALTEFLVFIKLYIGNDVRLYFCKEKDLITKQKSFSIISYVPTAASLAYMYKIFPAIQKQLHLKLSKQSQQYNPQFEKKFKKYVENNYKDLVVVNIGPDSCYINPGKMDKSTVDRLIEEGIADPGRLRTAFDYLVWAYKNKKHIIFINELDSHLCLGHELGHYLIEKESFGKVNKYLQDHQRKGLTNRKFIYFVGGCLGLFGPIGEIAGMITSFLLQTPLLYTEFLASYKGLEELKKAGISEKEYEEAKKFCITAWKTYLAGSTYRSVKYPSLGRITGELGRYTLKRLKK